VGYSFRNELVAQFLRNLWGQSGVLRATRPDREAHEGGAVTLAGPLSKIQELHRLEKKLQRSFDLKETTALIVEAWSALTECGKPTIAFCVGPKNTIWFKPARGESTDIAPFAATADAAAGALSFFRVFFGFDDDRVSVALPIQHGSMSVALTATVERSRLKVGLSEMSVQHWVQFVTGFEAHLVTLCLSALGVQHVAERQQPASAPTGVHRDHVGAFAYVLGFAYDCRGNPLADALITFELVVGDVRTPLGEVRTSADRTQPAGVIVPRRVDEKTRIEVRGSYAGQMSQPVAVDAASCWSCEFVFHVDDHEEGWTSLKRRGGWRCRHEVTQPEHRSVRAPAGMMAIASKAAG